MKGFTKVSDILIEKYGLNTAAIYGVIWRYCQMEKGHCEAKHSTIGSRLDISAKSVQRNIKPLLDDGYLQWMNPDDTHKPHIYICTDKLSQEEIGYYAQGWTICPPLDEEGRTESPPPLDKLSTVGWTESPPKRVVKETNKDITTEKDKKEKLEINFELPPKRHCDLVKKWVYLNQGTLDEPAFVKAYAARATPKKLELAIDGQNGSKLYSTDKVFYLNGGPGLNCVEPSEPENDGVKLSGDELAMKNRLIDLMGFDNSFSIPKHKLDQEMKLVQDSAIKSVKNGYTPDFIDRWEKWYYEHDWRGKRGDKPKLGVLRDTVKQFEKFEQQPKEAEKKLSPMLGDF